MSKYKEVECPGYKRKHWWSRKCRWFVNGFVCMKWANDNLNLEGDIPVCPTDGKKPVKE